MKQYIQIIRNTGDIMKSKQSGFTLIEIAIVLVIIGLLLGGVLKGQELINSAKVKNLATDFKNVPVYIYGYQDKFRALPGDDNHADAHLGAASSVISTSTTVGNGLIDGTWDDNLSPYSSETQLFWMHVRLANLAPGPTGAGIDLLPNNAVGGVVGVASSSSFASSGVTAGSAINASYVVCSSAIMGRYAKQLDIQMDDGVYNTGSLRIYTQTGRAQPLVVPTTTPDDNQTYTVCMGI
jgi:prepilin-type N-terminal cleavage/methylation domain-containing protein